MDAAYIPFHVENSRVSEALKGLWAVGVEGFNVTVPHKEVVLPMLKADAAATCIGAVNTVRRHATGWQGTNTDWQGFRDVLHGMEVDIAGTEALLFGAGGTARAVLHALVVGNVAKVSICNRGEGRLHTFIKHAKLTYPKLLIEPTAWNQQAVNAACEKTMLIINTTSIGLGSNAEHFPFQLQGKGVAVDAVYAQNGHTAFVCAAEKSGRRAVDGLPMLLAQGIASFYYWHQTKLLHIPAMRWLEARLDREPATLPGWEHVG